MSKNSELSVHPEYRMDIGIEVHVQLQTKSKIFCSCSNSLTETPNDHVCPVCCGYPGVLPVLNQQVVTYAIMAGLGTNCEISPVSEFDRKHYFYPDLPKNYQITQNDRPICRNGYVMIRLEDGSEKKIRINRIHIEEDAGKNIHSDITNESYVDLNRTGTPLLEIVTEPDIANAEEAKAYLKALRLIMQYVKVSECNMEEGSFRADTNLSVRKIGAEKLGTRCELKNINSFKFISDAIAYEFDRQVKAVELGERIIQETRLWDSKNRKSIPMRSKENLADYRYCTDPDLSLVTVTPEKVLEIKGLMPELPYEKYHRYIREYGLSDYEASIIVNDFDLTVYFDELMATCNSRNSVNWLLRDVLGLVKESKISIADCAVTPKKLGHIMKLLESSAINSKGARIVFEEIAEHGGEPAEIVAAKGLQQIGSSDELEAIVVKVLAENAQQVEKYRAGNLNLFGFFVGTCMKATQGKGNPKMFEEILKRLLS